MKGCVKVSPDPSLPQVEQPHQSLPLFTGEVPQLSDHCCGLLRTFSYRFLSPLCWGSQQHCRWDHKIVEGENHLPQPDASEGCRMSVAQGCWLLRELQGAPCGPTTCPLLPCRCLPCFGSGLWPSHAVMSDYVKRHLGKWVETEKCNMWQVGTSCTWGQTGGAWKFLNKTEFLSRPAFSVCWGARCRGGVQKGEGLGWWNETPALGRKKRRNLKESLRKKCCNCHRSGWVGSENGCRMNNKANKWGRVEKTSETQYWPCWGQASWRKLLIYGLERRDGEKCISVYLV